MLCNLLWRIASIVDPLERRRPRVATVAPAELPQRVDHVSIGDRLVAGSPLVRGDGGRPLEYGVQPDAVRLEALERGRHDRDDVAGVGSAVSVCNGRGLDTGFALESVPSLLVLDAAAQIVVGPLAYTLGGTNVFDVATRSGLAATASSQSRRPRTQDPRGPRAARPVGGEL